MRGAAARPLKIRNSDEDLHECVCRTKRERRDSSLEDASEVMPMKHSSRQMLPSDWPRRPGRPMRSNEIPVSSRHLPQTGVELTPNADLGGHGGWEITDILAQRQKEHSYILRAACPPQPWSTVALASRKGRQINLRADSTVTLVLFLLLLLLLQNARPPTVKFNYRLPSWRPRPKQQSRSSLVQ